MSLGHFGQADRNFRSFGLHTDLGTGAHSALIGREIEVLAIAAKDDWRLSSSTAGSGTASTSRSSTFGCARATGTTPRSARTS